MKTERYVLIIQRRPKIRAKNSDRWYEWNAFADSLDVVREELQDNMDNDPEDEWRIIQRITTVEEIEII